MVEMGKEELLALSKALIESNKSLLSFYSLLIDEEKISQRDEG